MNKAKHGGVVMAEKCGQLVKPIPSPFRERENAGEQFIWHGGNN